MFPVSRTHWVCPCLRRVCFPCLHCTGSRLLRWEVSEASHRLHAPPRPKPLRFRHSGSPQGRRLRWVCVLCPSQVRAARVIRCLAGTVTVTYPLSRACCLVFWVYKWMLTVQNPKKSQLAMKPTCTLVDNAFSGAMIAPFHLWLPVTGGAWSATSEVCSVLCSVSGPDGVS